MAKSDWHKDYNGNLDIYNRPQVKLKNGETATVRTSTFGFDDGNYLLPTISKDGKEWSDDEALANFRKTGEHLGKYATQEEAEVNAQLLHIQQAEQYGMELKDSEKRFKEMYLKNTPVKELYNTYKQDREMPEKTQGTTVTPLDAQKRVLEALASQSIGKSPINANSVSESINVVYQKNPAMESAEMQKPQAEYPSHLDGMMLRGGAMKGSIGYNPFEDYANVAMQRYNIEQQRLNNTMQRLPTPEFTTEYSTRQVQKGSEGQSNAYQQGQLDVANKELNLKQKELDAQLGKTKVNTVDELFDDKLIGQARPYLTGTEIDPNTGKAGWNVDAVRNTLQGGLIAIKQLYPEVEIPDISNLDLSDGSRIDGVRKFILGYADGAFDLPFSSQGIGFVPLKPKSQLSSRARAIIGSMNNYSTVTGGGKSAPVKQAPTNHGSGTQKAGYNYTPTVVPQKLLPNKNRLVSDTPSDATNYRKDSFRIPEPKQKSWKDYLNNSTPVDAQNIDSKKKIPSGYKIVKVLDGDTYILEDSKGNRSKYRASNFDTFESSDNSYTNSRIGKQATELNGNRNEVVNRGKGASQFADSLMRTNDPQIDVYEDGEDGYGRKLGNIAVKGLDMRHWLDSLHKGKYITKYGDSFKNRRK